jgi:hypothetical protein
LHLFINILLTPIEELNKGPYFVDYLLRVY